MPFPTTPILDDFNRANESPLAAPWATATYWWGSGLNLVSNEVANSDPACCSGSYWTSSTVGPDLEIYFTVAALATQDGDYFGVDLYTTAPTAGPLDLFSLIFTRQSGGASYSVALTRYDNDVPTAVIVAAANSTPLVVGDQLGIRRVGTTWMVFRNGLVIASASDSNYLIALIPGLYITDGARQTVRLDTFGGGTVTGSGGFGGTSFRFYPSMIAPNVRIDGPVPGTWDSRTTGVNTWDAAQQRWVASPTKTGAGIWRTFTPTTNQQGDWDAVIMEWQTPPLEAQTISGPFDLCFMTNIRWERPDGTQTDESHAVWKVHVCLMVGQSNTVRAVLLDNYVDGTEWQRIFAVGRWQALTTPQTLTTAAASAGDTIRIVVGVRILSSPTPAPVYPSPGNDNQYFSSMIFRAFGCTTAAGTPHPDAVPGNTTIVDYSPWFEFAGGLTLSAAPAPPANDACADAVVISGFPYQSPRIDTSQSAGTDREVWYTFVAPAVGRIFFTGFGSTYPLTFDLFTGGCGVLSNVGLRERDFADANRSLSTAITTNDVVQGTQYWLRVRSASGVGHPFHAANSGGSLVIQAFYRDTTPQVDDLYLPSRVIVAFRRNEAGELWPVNLSPGLLSFLPTGVAIDYTRRPMADLNGGTNTNERILIGLHDGNLVEILNLPDLSYGDGQFEVDFILDPINSPLLLDKHPAQLAITAAGELSIGFFGNGYLFLSSGAGERGAALNAPSDNSDYSAVRVLSATDGDSQPGAPFTAAFQYPAIEVIAPWAISINEAQNILYYTSGGFYRPVGGQEVRAYNRSTAVSLTFATLPSGGGPDPGLKGLEALPDGTVMACNATYAVRLSAAGAVMQTYTPSRPDLFQMITDIKVTHDASKVWIVDGDTTALALFDVATGVELNVYETWLGSGELVQMAIYQPEGVDFCPGTVQGPYIDGGTFTPPVFPPCMGTGERGDPPTGV